MRQMGWRLQNRQLPTLGELARFGHDALRLLSHKRAVQKLAIPNEGAFDDLTFELDRSAAATPTEQVVELRPNSHPAT